jgi:DNA-binding XRE family transcriptional regulator
MCHPCTKSRHGVSKFGVPRSRGSDWSFPPEGGTPNYCREEGHLTQRELARMLKSSQSRIAKMEKGDPSVSIDLRITSLLVLGTTRREIAKAIA